MNPGLVLPNHLQLSLYVPAQEEKQGGLEFCVMQIFTFNSNNIEKISGNDKCQRGTITEINQQMLMPESVGEKKKQLEKRKNANWKMLTGRTRNNNHRTCFPFSLWKLR